MQSLTLSARPDIEEEHPVELFHECVVDQSMDDTVPDGSHSNHALLRIADGERLVRTVAICPCGQFAFEGTQVFFEVVDEVVKRRGPSFAPGEALPCSP